MNELLYLEPDEEITSVIDRIKQSNATSLSLVVPREATLLQSVVNLRLLLKEATNLGKQIAIITADKIGRNLAAKVGLTVFESVNNQQPIFQPPSVMPTNEEIIEIDDSTLQPEKQVKLKGVQVHHFQQNQNWPKKTVSSPTSKPWQPEKIKIKKEIDFSKYKKILLPIASIIVLLLLIGAFLILPKVSVGIKVDAEKYQKDIDVTIAQEKQTSEVEKIFNGNLLDITAEKEEKFATTGKKNLGGKAMGTLTLYNYWDSASQPLASGTKFSSSSKTFVSKSAVTIPGTSISGGNIVPGSVTVDIEAENAGEEYNVKAGRFLIVGLSSAQQEKIYGQSSKNLAGGFTKEVQVVSQADFDKAKEKLTKELTENLNSDSSTKSKGLDTLETAAAIELTEETATPKIDDEATEFNLKIKMRLRNFAFKRDDFDEFIKAISEREIPPSKMISLGPNGSISPQVKEKKYDESKINLSVSVSAKISSRIDTEKVKTSILGKNYTDASNYLNTIDGMSGFEINYFPSWWPIKRIPNYVKNVDVNLEYLEPNNTESPSPEMSLSPKAISPNPEASL